MASNSSYQVAAVSSPFVAYNPNGGNMTITTANGIYFSFDSLYLTSAWRDHLNITVNIMRAGSISTLGTYSTMTTSRLLVYCLNCTNIGTIILQASNGASHSSTTQNSTQYIIDDLCISFGH